MTGTGDTCPREIPESREVWEYGDEQFERRDAWLTMINVPLYLILLGILALPWIM